MRWPCQCDREKACSERRSRQQTTKCEDVRCCSASLCIFATRKKSLVNRDDSARLQRCLGRTAVSHLLGRAEAFLRCERRCCFGHSRRLRCLLTPDIRMGNCCRRQRYFIIVLMSCLRTRQEASLCAENAEIEGNAPSPQHRGQPQSAAAVRGRCTLLEGPCTTGGAPCRPASLLCTKYGTPRTPLEPSRRSARI